jgi:hypothetical protein
VIVPVMMNGRGPYDFLLGTGSLKQWSMRNFPKKSNFPLVGEQRLFRSKGEKQRCFPAEAAIVSVAGAQVNQLTIGVVKSLASVPVKVRGVQGEDFLRTFDLLLELPTPFPSVRLQSRFLVRDAYRRTCPSPSHW